METKAARGLVRGYSQEFIGLDPLIFSIPEEAREVGYSISWVYEEPQLEEPICQFLEVVSEFRHVQAVAFLIDNMNTENRHLYCYFLIGEDAKAAFDDWGKKRLPDHEYAQVAAILRGATDEIASSVLYAFAGPGVEVEKGLAQMIKSFSHKDSWAIPVGRYEKESPLGIVIAVAAVKRQEDIVYV